MHINGLELQREIARPTLLARVVDHVPIISEFESPEEETKRK